VTVQRPARLPSERTPQTPFGVALGKNLRSARLRKGIALRNLAKASGGRLSGGRVGSYERAGRKPSAEFLAAMAEFYEVPLSDLIPDLSGGQS
jgi:transcriptional regulator with XRE-family HTH domain